MRSSTLVDSAKAYRNPPEVGKLSSKARAPKSGQARVPRGKARCSPVTPVNRFTPHIRTSGKARIWFPVFIETIGKAIDDVQALSKEKRDSVHWRRAAEALSASQNDPADRTKMLGARMRLCLALNAEGWLDEPKVV